MRRSVCDITHYSDLNLLLGAEVSHIGASGCDFCIFFLNIIFNKYITCILIFGEDLRLGGLHGSFLSLNGMQHSSLWECLLH